MTNQENKINKRTEVKFQTSKEFLTAYRKEVLELLTNAYSFKNYDLKILATAYFQYVNNSNFDKIFTEVLKKKYIKNTIKHSVNSFVSKYNENFTTNHNAIEDFKIERRNAQWNSKSF